MTTDLPLAIVSAPVPKDLLERMEPHVAVHQVSPGARLQEVVPPDLARRAVALLCTVRTRVTPELLGMLPSLRVVSNFAVGYDNIDVAAATRSGVVVCNTPGVLDAAVADLTMGLVLCLGRRLVQNDRYVRDGSWMRSSAPLASDLSGKTIGILGMGRIGRMVARRARAFDMEVIYHNRHRDRESEAAGLASYVDRAELFRRSDYVSVHIPLSEETRNSIGAAEFSLMKPSAFFINTARGAVVDETALVAALKDGRIAGAGLDVMVNEPLDVGSPLIGLPNVVLQPHVGSATVETRRAMIELAVANLLDVVANRRPRALVNPDAWSHAKPESAENV